MAVIGTRAALAAQHGTLPAHHVTEVLGVTPTESFDAGERYARGSRTREHAHWAVDSTVDGDLEAQLRALVDRFLPLRERLELLAREGYRLAWTCYVEERDGDGVVTLSSALLADLGTLPVDLWIDSYAETSS